MERNWFYRDENGTEYGPYTREEIERYALEGRISDGGEVREADGEWIPAAGAGIDMPIAMPADEPGGGTPLKHPATDSGEAIRIARESVIASPHQRVLYILLGILLPLLGGLAGINNLIVGRTSIGVIQLSLGLFSVVCLVIGGFLILPICIGLPLWLGVLIWSIVEASTNTLDGRGRVMG